VRLRPFDSLRSLRAGSLIPFALAVVIAAFFGSSLQAQMPNFREMSGRPLPSPDVPPGSLTVRVARGSFEKVVAGHLVDVNVDGESRTVTTGADGRALVSGLRTGNTVRVSTMLDGTRLDSQPIPIGLTGMMVALIGVDAEADAAAAAAPAAPAIPTVKGTVSLGQESRVIVELAENALRIFYVLEIVNAGDAPVDIDGPLIFDLPTEARGVAMLEDSTKQATANGPRIIVTGPFAPGPTVAQVAYELPYRGATARLEQVWPAQLQQLTLLVEQRGTIEIESPQITARNMVDSNGQPLIFASGPAIAAGQALTVNISGLPHHPTWPQWVAFALAMAVIGWGIWGAVTAPARRA
jgi:hypothetical protein